MIHHEPTSMPSMSIPSMPSMPPMPAARLASASAGAGSFSSARNSSWLLLISWYSCGFHAQGQTPRVTLCLNSVSGLVSMVSKAVRPTRTVQSENHADGIAESPTGSRSLSQ